MLRQGVSFVLLMLVSLALTGLTPSEEVRTAERRPLPPRIMRASDWNEQQAADWEKAKTEIVGIYQAGMPMNVTCKKTWDIAWPLAKAGNLEARYAVFTAFRQQRYLAYTTNTLHILSLPAIRTYLYYHSLGAPRLTAEIAYMRERIKERPKLISEYPEQDALKKYPEIQACVWEHPSQACTEMIGLSSPTSPSYERIAEELDMLFKAGVGRPCVPSDEISPQNPNMPRLVPNLLYKGE